jgi:hypothetical protein
MEKPIRPPRPSVVDIIFWQVSGALIGMVGGLAVVVWTAGPDPVAFVMVPAIGLVVGGALGMFFGPKHNT